MYRDELAQLSKDELIALGLAPNPDRIIESVAERCPHCEHTLTAADQSGFHAYDHVELPPIRPVITRIHRHRGICPSCRRGFSAPLRAAGAVAGRSVRYPRQRGRDCQHAGPRRDTTSTAVHHLIADSRGAVVLS